MGQTLHTPKPSIFVRRLHPTEKNTNYTTPSDPEKWFSLLNSRLRIPTSVPKITTTHPLKQTKFPPTKIEYSWYFLQLAIRVFFNPPFTQTKIISQDEKQNEEDKQHNNLKKYNEELIKRIELKLKAQERTKKIQTEIQTQPKQKEIIQLSKSEEDSSGLFDRLTQIFVRYQLALSYTFGFAAFAVVVFSIIQLYTNPPSIYLPTQSDTKIQIAQDTKLGEVKGIESKEVNIVQNAEILDSSETETDIAVVHDSNPDTYWASQTNASQQDSKMSDAYIVFDLKDVYALDKFRVKLSWQPDIVYPGAFGDSAHLLLQGSNDTNTWTDIGKFEINRSQITQTTDFGIEHTGSFRYIKVIWGTGEQNIWNGEGKIYEIGVFGQPMLCDLSDVVLSSCPDTTVLVVVEDEMWSFDSKSWTSTKLASLPRFGDICANTTKCTFDTYSYYEQGGYKIEMITVDGKFWEIKSQDNNHNVVSKGEITQIAKYTSAKICTENTKCTFDSHSFVQNEDGSVEEWITQNAQLWKFKSELPNVWTLIEQIDKKSEARYADNICKENSTGCKFDTHSIFHSSGERVEAILSDNLLYFVVDNNSLPLSLSPHRIANLDFLNLGPCAKFKPCSPTAMILGKNEKIHIWDGTGITAAETDKNGNLYLFNSKVMWQMDANTNLWKKVVGIDDILFKSQTKLDPKIYSQFRTHGVSAAWRVEQGIMTISQDSFVILDENADSIIHSGELNTYIYWKDSPEIDGISIWDEGIDAIWQTGQSVYVLSADKYWVQNTQTGEWIESGHITDLDPISRFSSVTKDRLLRDGITAVWSKDGNTIFVSRTFFVKYDTKGNISTGDIRDIKLFADAPTHVL